MFGSKRIQFLNSPRDSALKNSLQTQYSARNSAFSKKTSVGTAGPLSAGYLAGESARERERERERERGRGASVVAVGMDLFEVVAVSDSSRKSDLHAVDSKTEDKPQTSHINQTQPPYRG